MIDVFEVGAFGCPHVGPAVMVADIRFLVDSICGVLIEGFDGGDVIL